MKETIKINNLFKVGAISVALLSNAAYSATYDCTNLAEWQTGQVSVKGVLVKSLDTAYESRWWNKVNPVTHFGDWKEWKKLGSCNGVDPVNMPPTVSLISPAKNSTFIENDSVVFSVSAADEDGSVAKVELYVDDIKLSTLTNTPYQFTWSAALGEHVFKSHRD